MSLGTVSKNGHVSASQIKTAHLCMRKWWFDKVAHVRDRDRYHFAVGHALHATAERYLLKESSSWEGLFPPQWDNQILEEDAKMVKEMAKRAVAQGVWQAAPGIVVEYPVALLVGRRMLDHRGLPKVARAITFKDDRRGRQHTAFTTLYDGSPLPEGWDDMSPFVGFIDNLFMWDNPYPKVTDHKTAKNKTYTLNSVQLSADLQMNCYAALPLALYPEFDFVALRHNVFLKNHEDPQVFTTDAVVTAGAVARMWATVVETAEELHWMKKQNQKIEGVSPEHRADNFKNIPGALEQGRPEACEAFGKCPFRDACFGRRCVSDLVRDMDAPEVKKTPIIRPKRVTYSLNLSPQPRASTLRLNHPVI